MNTYALYHGDHLIRIYTAPTMGAICGTAYHDFERYRWEERQQGRQTSPLAFRLVPTKRAPGTIHPNWTKEAADD